MQLLPLDQLGARQTNASTLQFGMLLPWVTPDNGQQLVVKLVHEHDQFLVPEVVVPMMHSMHPRYGDLWSATVDLTTIPAAVAGSHWGKPGRYVYRYALSGPNGKEIDWIIDPYARDFGVGKQSAITVGYVPHTWSASEATWKTPLLEDLVMYELNLAEFSPDSEGEGAIDGAIDRLDYLADLGVNCIELMPVSNVECEIDWGYLPIGYFGVDERFGRPSELQRLVDEAHQRGIAVIVDSVYGHAHRKLFAYSYMYQQLGYTENPFMGPFAKDLFSTAGASADYNRVLTQDFFFTVNNHWLEVFHVDGFRYDCVPNFWDGPIGNGYANLAYATYEAVVSKIKGDNAGYWKRFDDGQRCNLIQCAEDLDDPRGILFQSYSTCTWQNETIDAAKAVAHDDPGGLYRLGASLALFGYPTEVTTNGETLPKAGLQYIENHDQSRFVANFGVIQPDDAGNEVFREGDRSLWYKVQPYLIGMLTAKGIPLLWEGQEIGESYTIPLCGAGRVGMLRPVRWDEFYDAIGSSIITLVRRLLASRRTRPEMRRGEYYFYNDHEKYQSKKVLVFHRCLADSVTVVALNFSDTTQYVPFTFPRSGDYQEQLHGYTWSVPEGTEVTLEIPSNYGRVWSRTGSCPQGRAA